MADATSLAGLLASLGNGSSVMPGNRVSLVYRCNRKNFFMDGTVAYLQWSATSVGGMNQGAPYELEFSGNVRVTYDPASNKLSSATLGFDTGAVSRQLKGLTFLSGVDFPSDLFTGASETDCLLDSLEMPVLPTVVISRDSSQKSVVSNDDQDDNNITNNINNINNNVHKQQTLMAAVP